ncbi:hypothetical protein BGW80DRAFT_1257904 [Lactifluus volemus]|nr:hypothetical protein BGW80DRAFT_1257904 [Lactifluus volemus]
MPKGSSLLKKKPRLIDNTSLEQLVAEETSFSGTTYDIDFFNPLCINKCRGVVSSDLSDVDLVEVAVARKRSPSPTVIFSGSLRKIRPKTRARTVNVEDSDSESSFLPSHHSLQKKKAPPPFASTSSPVLKEESSNSAVEKEQVIVKDEMRDAEHAQLPMCLDVNNVTKDDDPTPTHTDADSVMLVLCLDPALTDIYKGLAHLLCVYEIKSFSGSLESLHTLFSAKCEGIPIKDVKTIIKVLWFVKCGSYVNTARVNPKILSIVNNCLRITETKSMALYLVGSAEAGPPHSPYAIHKVTIAPFEQDFRHDTALWELLFDFHVLDLRLEKRVEVMAGDPFQYMMAELRMIVKVLVLERLTLRTCWCGLFTEKGLPWFHWSQLSQWYTLLVHTVDLLVLFCPPT